MLTPVPTTSVSVSSAPSLSQSASLFGPQQMSQVPISAAATSLPNVSLADLQSLGLLSQLSIPSSASSPPVHGGMPFSAGTSPSPVEEILKHLSLSSSPIPPGIESFKTQGNYTAPSGISRPDFFAPNPMSNSSPRTLLGLNFSSPQFNRTQSLQSSIYGQQPVNNLYNGSLASDFPLPLTLGGLGGRMTTSNNPKHKDPRKLRQQEQLSANKERTIYISEVEHNVTEADIAILFSSCGDVVDCRMCGDAHSRMRFAFVEFSVETYTFAVPAALKLNNTRLGGVAIKVQRSRTAIVPVKKELLPASEDEMERTQKTIYASNIDKRFTQKDVLTFFEAVVKEEDFGVDGKVARVKMFVDGTSNTSTAFLEFVTPESANAALKKCQGALMGCLPLRVSPSKTPIRTPEEERAVREMQRKWNQH
eukprot:TRINITY_DN25389_c0_g2_i2.p1 TRINITY_DN25389_c0_g2~~TRINITY_DN25389_c0_g2_i2.p1  ORF type:complete len:421 (-),score=54.68 TRINITY_DN25389_c0_g2_i2:742-2004(-)